MVLMDREFSLCRIGCASTRCDNACRFLASMLERMERVIRHHGGLRMIVYSHDAAVAEWLVKLGVFHRMKQSTTPGRTTLL